MTQDVCESRRIERADEHVIGVNECGAHGCAENKQHASRASYRVGCGLFLPETPPSYAPPTELANGAIVHRLGAFDKRAWNLFLDDSDQAEAQLYPVLIDPDVEARQQQR